MGSKTSDVVSVMPPSLRSPPPCVSSPFRRWLSISPLSPSQLSLPPPLNLQ